MYIYFYKNWGEGVALIIWLVVFFLYFFLSFIHFFFIFFILLLSFPPMIGVCVVLAGERRKEKIPGLRSSFYKSLCGCL